MDNDAQDIQDRMSIQTKTGEEKRAKSDTRDRLIYNERKPWNQENPKIPLVIEWRWLIFRR